jgi:prepilin-type N-terminal cleavage/methylation domain-containing protein
MRSDGGRVLRAGPGRRLSPHCGFTLIEILVTLVILSTGIVVVLGALQGSVAALGESRDVLFSSFLIEERLAAIESDLATGGDAPVSESGAFESPFDGFLWSVSSERLTLPTVHDAGADPEDAEKTQHPSYRIKIEVWRDGAEEKQTLETFVSEGGGA